MLDFSLRGRYFELGEAGFYDQSSTTADRASVKNIVTCGCAFTRVVEKRRARATLALSLVIIFRAMCKISNLHRGQKY